LEYSITLCYRLHITESHHNLFFANSRTTLDFTHLHVILNNLSFVFPILTEKCTNLLLLFDNVLRRWHEAALALVQDAFTLATVSCIHPNLRERFRKKLAPPWLFAVHACWLVGGAE
jgi:hypothetical protein